MIEYNNIYDGLYYVIKNAVGDKLTQRDNGEPYIYPYGDGGEFGTYPFVIIQRDTTIDNRGSLTHNKYFDDNDYEVTEKKKTIQYFIRVLGSNAANSEGVYTSASEIASIIEGYLSTDKAYTTFNEHVDCSAIGYVTSNVPSYSGTGDQIYESCTLGLTINTTLTFVDESPDVIETVVIDAEAKRNQEDTNPLPIDITVTTT